MTDTAAFQEEPEEEEEEGEGAEREPDPDSDPVEAAVFHQLRQLRRSRDPVLKPDLSPYPSAVYRDPATGDVLFLADVGDRVAVESPDPYRSTYLGVVDKILTGDEPGCSGVRGNVVFYVQSMGQCAMTNYYTALAEGWKLVLYPHRRLPAEPRKKIPRKTKRERAR